MQKKEEIARQKAKLAERRTQLTDEKRILLEKRLRGQTTNALQAAIPRAPRQQRVPLSFAQQRLWFLDQLEPGRPFYNIPAAIRLPGRLDVTALARSLNEVIRRHEILRTTFQAIDGQPIQTIAPSLSVPLPLVDLSELPTAMREAQVARLTAEEAQYPFDLAHGPLIRVTLLRLGPEEHLLLLTMHHITSDGWSVGVLIGEIASLYSAFFIGGPAPLPELPIQYADFAAWQRAWLQGEVLDTQLRYWKQQLVDAPALLELPTDRPRP